MINVRLAFLTLVLLCASVSGAFAQVRAPFIIPAPPKDTSTFWIFKDITGGPYFTGGISQENADLPASWHSSSRFSYDIGGTIDFYYTQWLGVDLSMFYDSRDLYAETSGESIDVSLGYLALEPSVRLLWLLLGFTIDVPLSGSAIENLSSYHRADHSNPNTSDYVSNYDENLNVSTTDLQTLFELHATLSIPVLENEGSELHLVVSGHYPLTKTILSTDGFDTTGYTKTSGIGTPTNPGGRFSGSSQVGKGPLPTIEAGISYQFDILH
jgi:hypothetical protein